MIRGVSPHDPSRTPIDQALDLFVFLPVGFVLELPRSIPRFIERGRRELGAEATPTDGPDGFESPGPLDRVQAHAVGTLRALGMLPRQDADGAGAVEVEVDEVDLDLRDLTTASVTPEAAPEPRPSASAPEPEPGDGVAAAVGVAADEPAMDADTLAIPGYDSLSASQVMPRLEGLSTDELELVRLYELANRGRKTILNKIAQIQAG
jgi:hypothetical protein